MALRARRRAATLTHDLPDVIRLGGRYAVPDMELRLFGDYTRWSVLERHVVRTDNDRYLLDQDRSWKDTFGVRAGVNKW
jgi:long-subunit fatty acid transport protein